MPASVSQSPGAQAPLVVEMHGYGSRNTALDYTKWEGKAVEHGFVLVRPMGTEKLVGQRNDSPSWNAGWCCGASIESKADVDDVGFIRKVVSATVGSDGFTVDVGRVYMVGHSNGCAMAQRMAVDASDIVAAVACHSHYLVTEVNAEAIKSAVPTGYAAVPVMTVHGTTDSVVKYLPKVSGGALGAGLEKNLELWKEINGCGVGPGVSAGPGFTVETFTGCDGGGAISAVTLPDVGHSPFQGTGTEVDTTQMTWDFVSQFRREGPVATGEPEPASAAATSTTAATATGASRASTTVPGPGPGEDEATGEPERGVEEDEGASTSGGCRAGPLLRGARYIAVATATAAAVAACRGL